MDTLRKKLCDSVRILPSKCLYLPFYPKGHIKAKNVYGTKICEKEYVDYNLFIALNVFVLTVF